MFVERILTAMPHFSPLSPLVCDQIPKNLSTLSDLKKLDLQTNSLTGNLEEEMLEGLTSLTQLSLTDNSLTGAHSVQSSNSAPNQHKVGMGTRRN